MNSDINCQQPWQASWETPFIINAGADTFYGILHVLVLSFAAWFFSSSAASSFFLLVGSHN